ncbi:hypothetical protein GQ42DRAFT_153738 [Ramicandelaber brevisporus]|nr:hypothetical protein GQ42DRAFT_153738 [Ramicandelaber brevisporus]
MQQRPQLPGQQLQQQQQQQQMTGVVRPQGMTPVPRPPLGRPQMMATGRPAAGFPRPPLPHLAPGARPPHPPHQQQHPRPPQPRMFRPRPPQVPSFVMPSSSIRPSPSPAVLQARQAAMAAAAASARASLASKAPSVNRGSLAGNSVPSVKPSKVIQLRAGINSIGNGYGLHHVMKFKDNKGDLTQFEQPTRLARRSRYYKRGTQSGEAIDAIKQAKLDNINNSNNDDDDMDENDDEEGKADGKNNEENKERVIGGAIQSLADKSKIAPGVNRERKKVTAAPKTKQVFYASEEARRLAEEERYPWLIEDYRGKECYEGTLAGGQTDHHMIFINIGDHMKVIPVDKWFKFASKPLQDRVMSLEQAEQTMIDVQKNELHRWNIIKERTRKLNEENNGGDADGSEKKSKRKVKESTSSESKRSKRVKNEDDDENRGADSDADELDYDENFQDDEEGEGYDGDVALDQYSGQKIRKTYGSLFADLEHDTVGGDLSDIDNDEFSIPDFGDGILEDDNFNSVVSKKPKLNDTGRSLKGFLRETDGNLYGTGDSDDERVHNPYLSSDEEEEEEENGEANENEEGKPSQNDNNRSPQPDTSSTSKAASRKIAPAVSTSKAASSQPTASSAVSSRQASPAPPGRTSQRSTGGMSPPASSREASPGTPTGPSATLKRRLDTTSTSPQPGPDSAKRTKPNEGGGALPARTYRAPTAEDIAALAKNGQFTITDVVKAFGGFIKSSPENKNFTLKLIGSIATKEGNTFKLK